ncbi:PIN domain-containing protein [Modestobacter sp. VKM Ac-2984]|uniref:PIN domain-containing protein n=1 Tax=Modestobacter sp. VKM Ac-2984 TaxID=3004138 RepID=UPI0022AAE357|nr:PIN domain-containing protein [Modestobacter sp. VKM Ac-2984]MCZ2815226.1 PIN domain-containing protein [Modestobacter sp. VKM Ac-2984]
MVAASRVILDTDAFSFLFSKRPQAANYGTVLTGRVPALTFVSVAELRFGALVNSWGEKRRADLEASIRRCVLLPFDDQLSTVWAELRARAQRLGLALAAKTQANDCWIAACGVYYDAPILTGNIKHFEGLDLKLIDGSGTP